MVESIMMKKIMIELKQVEVVFTSTKINYIIINFVKSISFKINFVTKYTLKGGVIEGY